MIPILFDANATSFNTNGIGRLSDTIDCVVEEERNGPFELEMTYPVTGVHYSDIALSKIIAVKASPKATLQSFRIYRISRPLGGQVTINARHISYQLSYIPVRAFSANSLAGALAGFKSNALEPCPFTLTADFTSSSSYAIPLPASIKSYLFGREGSIVDVYGNGAEWEWDNYNCILHAHRGQDRGVVIRYGKNLTDITQETNIENTITGIMSYWKSDEITVTLQTPEESPTAANFPFPRTVVMDFSDQFDNAPTVAELKAATRDYMNRNNVGVPKVNMDVSFVNLADTIEYKDGIVQDIYLCDSVTVDFVNLGVQTKAKVVKTKYNVLKERYDSINIGDGASTVSKTIEEQSQQISARPTTDETQSRIDRATGVLNSGLRGHVIINRNEEGWANEILFLDDENVARAKNVLRINTNGIGFSSTGYNGPYYQSWTIDGHLALGGVNNSYGDFEILDSSGKKLGQWNKDGLSFYDSAQKLLLSINHGGLYLYDATGKTLAQLTSRGLNVYEGSIEGGTITIGQNFSVDSNGNMTANNGKFNGGTITIGKNFSVNDQGIMKANGASFAGDITAGTITIGKNFSVSDQGIMKASGAEFRGDMKAGTITIGQNFSVSDQGIMKAKGAEFSGDIKGAKITGSTFESITKDKDGHPMFEVTNSYFKFIDYYATNASGGGEGTFLEKRPGGIRINTSGFGDNDGWLLWSGWRDPNDYPDTSPEEVFAAMAFGIHEDEIFAYDIYLQSLSYRGGDFCSVTDVLNSLEMRVIALESRVNGGGD